MPNAPRTPAAKPVPPPSEPKGPPPAKKPTNPFVDKHPGKPGRNASGQAHRRAR